MATQLWEIGLIVIATFFIGIAPIFLKKGLNKIHGFKVKFFINNWNLLIGVISYGMSYVISIPALKNGDLSVLYPFVALTYIWVSLFSVKFLDEKMNVVKWSGIFLIIVGVSFIGFGI